MTIIRNILIGTAGIAATMAFAAPAAAQYYPQQQGGVLGAIINSVTGGGRYSGYGYNGYGVNTQVGVQQCAAAVEQRLNGGYGGSGGHDSYGNHIGGYGSNAYGGGGRVVSITHADRHSQGTVKVKGLASSGQSYGGYGNQGYNQGYNNGYNNGYGQNGYQAQQQADLRFTCRVNMRGQVSELRISRNQSAYYRGY